MNNCFICRAPTQGRAAICTKLECKQAVEKSVPRRFVTGDWWTSPVVSVHLAILLRVVASSQRGMIFAPFPAFLTGADGVRDFPRAAQLTDRLLRLWAERPVEAPASDAELVALWGDEPYYLLKFVLMTAPPLELIYSVDRVTDSSMAVKNQGVGLVLRFKSDDGAWSGERLFHGSNAANWWSILRNGLKVCSDSKLQANGAAYGAGIYAAPKADGSVRYSSSSDNMSMMAVIETRRPAATYRQAEAIYVIKDCTEVRLRYLLVYDKSVNVSTLVQHVK